MTLIPELERDLVEAAERQRTPRRRRRAGLRAGLAALVVAALAAGSVALTREDESPERGRGVPAGVGAEPELEDLLGVFRRAPTRRDRSGISIEELEATGDRQPGEDTTRSRRIDLAEGPVYLWPMRGGVCASWGNCLGLDLLQRLGVALGTEGGAGRGGSTRLVVSGIVVDGIEEVAFEVPGMDPVVVQVEDNVFRADLSTTLPAPERATWTYRGRKRSQPLPSFDDPAPPVTDPPRPDPRPVRNTLSRPVSFAFAGVRYTMVGFRSRDGLICTRLMSADAQRSPSGSSCLSEKLLRRALRGGAQHTVAGGGDRPTFVAGFARADVTGLAVAGSRQPSRVVLSKPWRPKPWTGEPIRFFYALVDQRVVRRRDGSPFGIDVRPSGL